MADKGKNSGPRPARRKAKPVRRAKKSAPKGLSSLVLVLSGSTALRRKKAAGVLAAELKLDLFRVDLSAVVSQYIGETEKNLNQVFDKAAAEGAILCFDEVDALFGKRSPVNHARDRYLNDEAAHFLQRIESHDGIIILTTNGTQRIDQVFPPQTPVVVMAGISKSRRLRT